MVQALSVVASQLMSIETHVLSEGRIAFLLRLSDQW